MYEFRIVCFKLWIVNVWNYQTSSNTIDSFCSFTSIQWEKYMVTISIIYEFGWHVNPNGFATNPFEVFLFPSIFSFWISKFSALMRSNCFMIRLSISHWTKIDWTGTHFEKKNLRLNWTVLWEKRNWKENENKGKIRT